MMYMPSILFICTANRFRSPLAAAMLRHNLAEMGVVDAWHVSSAGTWAVPGQPVLPGLSDVAREIGLDLSGHRSVRVSRQMLAEHDLVLVMQAGQKEALLNEFADLQERVYLLSDVAERRSYDIPDALDSEQAAVEVVAELDRLIRNGLEYICVLATYLHNTRHKAGVDHG